jgi:hypothetical protein
MSLLDVPAVPGSPPTRWLNGWRRLWIVVVVSLPITLFSAARLNPRSELEPLLDAAEDARRAAYERAFERVTGASVNLSLNARLGTTEPDTFAAEGSISASTHATHPRIYQSMAD